LELSAEALDGRYRKIQAQPGKIEALLIQRGVKSIPRRSAKIVLDFDATDDPLHGNQQGAYFHGYYRGYCYLPLYCFCGNIPLLAQLRAIANATPVRAPWKPSKRSCPPFGSALAARCASSCGPTAGLPATQS
jgi:hypothetical protein